MPPLSALQLRGLMKAGDILIPGGEDHPSFSASGASGEVARVLAPLPVEDQKGLFTLLALLGILPKFLARFFLELVEQDRWFPGPVGTAFRLVALGIKGIILTLYYSDAATLKRIGWDAKVHASGGTIGH